MASEIETATGPSRSARSAPVSALHRAAREAAQNGWRVLPLYGVRNAACACPAGASCGNSTGKHPRAELTDWPRRATTNQDEIDAWWTLWPESNIGIVTSGVIVLDVDPRKTPGADPIDALELLHGALQAGLRARTGSGGEHRIYLAPAGITLRNRVGTGGALPVGVDVRAGDGGLIVVSPSVHASGGAYEWIDLEGDSTFPTRADVTTPAPDWLVALLEAEDGTAVPPMPPAPASRTTALGRVILAEECERVRNAPLFGRNHTLYTSARPVFELVAGGEIASEDAWDELFKAALACERRNALTPGWHPFPPREIRRSLVSAMNSGLQRPRCVRAPRHNAVPLTELYRWQQDARTKFRHTQRAMLRVVDSLTHFARRFGRHFFITRDELAEHAECSVSTVVNACAVLRESRAGDFRRILPTVPPPHWEREKCTPGREQSEIVLAIGDAQAAPVAARGTHAHARRRPRLVTAPARHTAAAATPARRPAPLEQPTQAETNAAALVSVLEQMGRGFQAAGGGPARDSKSAPDENLHSYPSMQGGAGGSPGGAESASPRAAATGAREGGDTSDAHQRTTAAVDAPAHMPTAVCADVEARVAAAHAAATGEAPGPQHPGVVAAGLACVAGKMARRERPFVDAMPAALAAAAPPQSSPGEWAALAGDWIADTCELLVRYYGAAGLKKPPYLGWLMADGARRFEEKVGAMPAIVRRAADADARLQEIADKKRRDYASYLASRPEQEPGVSDTEHYAAVQKWHAARLEDGETFAACMATTKERRALADAELERKLEAQAAGGNTYAAAQLRRMRDRG